jgi:hypothetical protein
MSRNQLQVMSIFDLAVSTQFQADGMAWHFPTVAAARLHLRKYEKLIAHWAAMFGMPRASVSGGGEEFPITPRLSNINPEVTPLAAVPQFDSDDQLLIAQQWLNAALLDVLLDMRQNPGIAALVNWDTQKQVVLTRACAQIPIGQQLADCLRYAREDYWVPAHLEEFKRECRQRDNVEFKYLTFDPTTGDDWIEIVGRYRFVDAGQLGLFQLGRNTSFERVAAPAAR